MAIGDISLKTIWDTTDRNPLANNRNVFAILTFGSTVPTLTFAILICVCNSHVFIIGSPHNIVPYIRISMNVKE